MNMERFVSGARRREGHDHGQTRMCTTGRDKTVTEKHKYAERSGETNVQKLRCAVSHSLSCKFVDLGTFNVVKT